MWVQFSISYFVMLATTLCGILSILLYHVRRLHLYKGAARYPGPSPVIPFIGNAIYFAGDPEDILNKVSALIGTYPAPFRFWLGNRLFIVVHKAEHLKTILLSPKTIEKEDLYKFVQPWMGTGLFTAPASKWRVHRKLIAPAFNTRILESFVEVFSRQSKIMVQQMEIELDGEEFDIFNYVSRCTLDIICESAMGVTVNAQTEKNSRYVDAAKRAFEVIYARMFKIWLHPDMIFYCTRLGKDQRESLEYLHSVTNEVIKQKKIAQSNENVPQDTVIEDDQKPRRKAFLDLLMELSNEGTKFSDEELREEVDTMMIAGNDTTATVNCFVFLMLASHPDIQEKVYKELCEIYGHDDDDRDVVCEDLSRMEYMERVIKESMRLFPVGPVLVRAVTEDLKIDEHTFPKGSSIVLGILEAHRSEVYWPNPLKFDPDRFLPEETAKRHPYCYIPFSAGPRNCLGPKYAMMSMKALLATVLRRYTIKKDIITPIKDIKLRADLMLKPMEPIRIRIESRTPTISYI